MARTRRLIAIIIPIVLIAVISLVQTALPTYALAKEGSLSASNALNVDTEIVLDYLGCDMNAKDDVISLQTDFVKWGDATATATQKTVPSQNWIESRVLEFEGWNFRTWSVQNIPDSNRIVVNFYYWRNTDGENSHVLEFIDTNAAEENAHTPEAIINELKEAEMLLNEEVDETSSENAVVETDADGETSLIVNEEQPNQSPSSVSAERKGETSEQDQSNNPIALILIAALLAVVAIAVTAFFIHNRISWITF